MDKKTKIKLDTVEKIAEFINICGTFNDDINIWNGHIVIDAKSIISMFKIANGKTLETEIISSDDNEIKRFMNNIKRFEVI